MSAGNSPTSPTSCASRCNCDSHCSGSCSRGIFMRDLVLWAEDVKNLRTWTLSSFTDASRPQASHAASNFESFRQAERTCSHRKHRARPKATQEKQVLWEDLKLKERTCPWTFLKELIAFLKFLFLMLNGSAVIGLKCGISISAEAKKQKMASTLKLQPDSAPHMETVEYQTSCPLKPTSPSFPNPTLLHSGGSPKILI